MKGYIKQLLREGLFGKSDFDDFKIEDHGKVIDESIETKDMTFNLYRGLKKHKDGVNPELVEYDEEHYILMVNKFKDKLIYFTRDEEFAKGYGEFALITYELLVKKHVKVLTYEDGHKENDFYYGNTNIKSAYGRGIISGESSSNSPLYYGIELPNHWLWSGQVQKHILRNSDLIIPKRNVKII